MGDGGKYVAVALLMAGAVVLLVALGLIQTPPGGGGGGGTTTSSPTTTTTTTTTFPPLQGQLEIWARDNIGRHIAVARIYVDGSEVSQTGYALVTVSAGMHRVTWGDVPQYATPQPVDAFVGVGQRVTIVGVYIPAGQPTYILTVWVRVCSTILNICYDHEGAEVRVGDVARGMTGADGKARFNVAAGTYTVKVVSPAYGEQTKTVAVSSDTTVEFRYNTSGLSIIPTTAGLVSAALFLGTVLLAYLLVRRWRG